MNERNGSTITKYVATTAILLAICIASQFLKNLSVYITGPIVNLCLILAVMTVGVMWGVILGIITPITASLVAASPVISAVPVIVPLIMLGNVVLVLMVNYLFKPSIEAPKTLINPRSVIMAVLSCLAKGAVMGLTISLWVLPLSIPEASPLREKLPVFQTMFSVTQFVTALIGFIYFFLIWKPLGKIFVNEKTD